MKLALVEISNMEFHAFHGCYKEEKIVGNKFIVDFEYMCDVERATLSDSINDTISYLEVYELIKEQIMINSDILENVADRALNSVVVKFTKIEKAKIKISKMTPPLGGYVERVSVSLTYTKDYQSIA